MQVFNLGNLERRKNPLNEMSDVLQKKRETDISQQKANADTSDADARQKMLQVELARLQHDKDKQNMEMGYKVVQDMSSRALQMDPTMRQMWLSSPQGQQLTKVVKTYAPNFIDENGQVTLLSKQDLAKDRLEQMKLMYLEKKQNGIATTPGEDTMGKLLFNPGTEAMAKVYQAATDDPNFMQAQAAGDKNKMASIVQSYVDQIFPQSSGAVHDTTQQAPDANDPLGLLQKQK